MSIYINDYLIDKTKFESYKEEINTALCFKDSSGKQSKWVHFLEEHDIVIAPGEANVGETFKEYETVKVSTIPEDKRTFKEVPGTFFAKGTVLNGTKIDKHIVYMNMKASTDQYTSMNPFAHELGHAIDHSLAESTHYYSSEDKFKTVYDANEKFFENTDLDSRLKAYFVAKTEFFAECFAFYRTKNMKLKDNKCFHKYFKDTLLVDDQNNTPNEYLKKYAPAVSACFKNLE